MELTAVFTDVGDLVAGHSVQVADVRVGSITGIELTDDYQAKVTMRIKDGLAPARRQRGRPAHHLAARREVRRAAPAAETARRRRAPTPRRDGEVLVDG